MTPLATALMSGRQRRKVRGLATDEPLRVAHEDSEEYDQFVTDPEAAAEATRARMDAQAEAEKAAAGITPAAEDS